MIRSYHNTTKETGPELAQSISKAMNQEDVIMSLFETYRNIYGKLNVMSPSYIQGIWINGVDRKAYPPITSIRRAMTTLTRKGMLIKTDKLTEGQYGKPEHCWRLAKEDDKQLNLL
mgnify:FL=1